MDTQKRKAAMAVSAGRIAAGAGFLVAPGRMLRAWSGIDAKSTPAARMVATSVGVRDLLLGVGLCRALQRRQDVATWLWYGVAADAVDALGALRDFRALPLTGRLALPVALGAAAAGVALASGE